MGGVVVQVPGVVETWTRLRTMGRRRGWHCEYIFFMWAWFFLLDLQVHSIDGGRKDGENKHWVPHVLPCLRNITYWLAKFNAAPWQIRQLRENSWNINIRCKLIEPIIIAFIVRRDLTDDFRSRTSVQGMIYLNFSHSKHSPPIISICCMFGFGQCMWNILS